ncbi:MAG: 30S ribosomal protein S6--L-glutamate ligase, partial [Saprospiraceae bacterium]
MKILILSRGHNLYSTQRLYFAGQKQGHDIQIIDYLECNIVIEEGKPQVFWRGSPLRQIDAIIPRIGSSQTDYGAAIIHQFEMMGVFSLLSANALLCARSKLW